MEKQIQNKASVLAEQQMKEIKIDLESLKFKFENLIKIIDEEYIKVDVIKREVSELPITDVAPVINKPPITDVPPVINKPPITDVPPISLIFLRSTLAEKSRQGFREQVRQIILNHGVEKLTDLDQQHYQQVLDEVAAIK